MEALSRQEYPALLQRLQPTAAAGKLNDRVKKIGKVNAEIADWLQERRKVEDAYVAGLRKLARRPLQEIGAELGVFDTPWRRIVTSTEELSKAHSHLSDRIEKDIETPLRAFATTNREMQAMSTIQGNLAAMAKDVEEAQHNVDKLSRKGGKASAQKVEAASTKLQNANQQWDAQAPFVFESLQSLDERRLNHLRDILTQLQTHETDLVETNRITVEQTLTSVLEIDTAQEIKNWAQSVAAGKPITERRARQLSNAGTTSGSINTNTDATSMPPPQTPRSNTEDRTESVAKPEKPEKPDKPEGSSESKLKSRFGTILSRRRQSVHGGFSREKSPSKGFPIPFTSRNSASREGRPIPSPRASSTNLRESPSRDNRLTSLAESPPTSSPSGQTNGTHSSLTGVTAGNKTAPTPKGSLSVPNGTTPTDLPDLSDVQPPPGPPPSQLKATSEAQKDSDGFNVRSAANDPISQAENDALQGSEQPQFKLDIRKEPIQEQDADAQAALSNVANTLRSSQLAPNRKIGTVRGRRDVRNTIFVPQPDNTALGVASPESYLPPSPSIGTGRATALATLSSTDQAPPPASDTTSIRSGHSLTHNAALKHADMHEYGLNASIIETISATFENGEIKETKISGEIALNYNKDEGDPTSPPNEQKIRINNFPNLEAIGPNRTFVHPTSDDKPEEFTVDTSHVSSKPSVAFTYRVHIDETNDKSHEPLLFKSAWKPQDNKLALIVEYSLNPKWGAETITFNNLVLVAIYQGAKATGCQTKPSGTHLKEKSLVYWRLGDVVLGPEPQKVICRFTGVEGAVPEPGHIEARWEIHGSSVAGSGISLSRLEPSKGKEKEEAADPFADDSISNFMAGPSAGNWAELESSRKYVSGKYEAR